MYMKQILLLAAVKMCSILSIHAQQTDDNFSRHEAAVSYGVCPSSVWVHIFADIIDALTGSEYDDSQFIGPISAEYFYHPKTWVGLGGIFSFNTRHNDRLKNGTKVGERDRTYFTVMPAVKFDYLRTKNFGMYVKIGAGYTFGSDTEKCDGKEDNKDTHGFFNFQLSLLGLEAGSQHLRGFAELGVGEQGMLLAGLRYKF